MVLIKLFIGDTNDRTAWQQGFNLFVPMVFLFRSSLNTIIFWNRHFQFFFSLHRIMYLSPSLSLKKKVHVYCQRRAILEDQRWLLSLTLSAGDELDYSIDY